MKSPPNIELQIDELTLHGFEARDRYRIAAAVEQELARLIAEQGMPSNALQSSDIAHIDGSRFTLAQGSRAETIGAQIARAVYGSLIR